MSIMSPQPPKLDYSPKAAADARRTPGRLWTDVAIGSSQLVIGLIAFVLLLFGEAGTTWGWSYARDVDAKTIDLIRNVMHRIFGGKVEKKRVPTVEEAIAEAYRRQALDGTLRRNLKP